MSDSNQPTKIRNPSDLENLSLGSIIKIGYDNIEGILHGKFERGHFYECVLLKPEEDGTIDRFTFKYEPSRGFKEEGLIPVTPQCHMYETLTGALKEYASRN